MIYGGVEAGGTKWVCATGTGPDDLRAQATIPTTQPADTIARVAEFFQAHDGIAAIGIGSFGPLDLDRGTITTTPKPGWSGTDVVALLSSRLHLPVVIDTDVNAAALGEHRWGAAQGLDTFCYVTVGTGVGGGAMVRGELTHGLLHPEFGHMRIPHDRGRDPFPGSCPYHGDCFEGLASGESMHARWGKPAHENRDETAWALEAEYVGLGIINVICTVSPQRLILGGGVMKEPTLLPRIRGRVTELAGGYFDAPQLRDGIDGYIVAPALGDYSGVLGALELARLSVDGSSSSSRSAIESTMTEGR